MISLDFLNANLQDFQGPMQHTFIRSLFLLDILNKRKQKSKGGLYIERAISSKPPAKGVALRQGDETYDMTRRTSIEKWRVGLYRMGFAINIPRRELVRNSGVLGVIKIMQEYPKLTMEMLAQNLEEYHLTGQVSATDPVMDAASLDGLCVLNGQFVSPGTGEVGTANGLLDFIAPASQTDLVQDFTKSFAKGVYNQYGAITSWAADGDDTMRRQYRLLAQHSGDKSCPDVFVCTDGLFSNVQRDKRDQVRLTVIQDNVDKANADPLIETFMGGRCKLITSISMDPSRFTGAAANGAGFFLNTKFWEYHELEALKLSPFEKLIANQDVVTATGTWEGQLLCNQLKAQGAISGGDT